MGVEDVIAAAPVGRESAMRRFDQLIREAAPQLEPWVLTYQGEMIGYGRKTYNRRDQTEVEWFVVGLANRKNYISLYSVAIEDGDYLVVRRAPNDFPGEKTGKSCINIRKPALVDDAVVTDLARRSWDQLRGLQGRDASA